LSLAVVGFKKRSLVIKAISFIRFQRNK